MSSPKIYAFLLGSFILLGVYVSFLPNSWTNASFFDFFKDEKSRVDSNMEFDLEAFSRVPVLRGGRVKPLDSVARNILLVLRNKRSALRILEDGEQTNQKIINIPQNGVETKTVEVQAIDWLAQVLFHPEKADNLKTFLIDHDQVLGLINRKLLSDGKFYSFNDLNPFLSNIDSSARKAGEVDTELRDSFQQNIIELYRSILIYKKLKHSLSPPSPAERPESLAQLGVTDLVFNPDRDKARSEEYFRFRELTAALSKNPTAVKLGSDEFAKVVFFVDRYNQANLWTEFLPIPPVKGDSKGVWMKVTESLVGSEPLDSKQKQNMDPSRFASVLRELLALDASTLKSRIEYIRDNQKMDAAALFATQYAEAIKLKKGVDPVITIYEDIATAFREENFRSLTNFNIRVLDALTHGQVPNAHPRTLKKYLMDSNHSTVVRLLMYSYSCLPVYPGYWLPLGKQLRKW